jgi:hypothetical protein
MRSPACLRCPVTVCSEAPDLFWLFCQDSGRKRGCGAGVWYASAAGGLAGGNGSVLRAALGLVLFPLYWAGDYWGFGIKADRWKRCVSGGLCGLG